MYSALLPTKFANTCNKLAMPATASTNTGTHASGVSKYTYTTSSAAHIPVHHGQPNKSEMVRRGPRRNLESTVTSSPVSTPRPVSCFQKKLRANEKIMSYDNKRVNLNVASAISDTSNVLTSGGNAIPCSCKLRTAKPSSARYATINTKFHIY